MISKQSESNTTQEKNPVGRETQGLELSSGSLTCKFEERPAGLYVKFEGDIDENVDLKSLRERLHGRVFMDLADIRRINSAGVREWVNFIRRLPRVDNAELIRCSPTIVNQLNMIFNFKGVAKVKSFFAPYLCESCDVEVDVLLDVDVHFFDRDPSKVPAFNCQECGEPLAFDVIPERYFAFILQS